MKHVIVINGKARSGKDTFVDFCRRNSRTPVVSYSTIDTVKFAARTFFGWHGQKSERARKFLSDLKDAWTNYNDGPFEEIKKKVYMVPTGLVFLHVREPREIKKIKEHFFVTCLTLLVRRPGLDAPNNHADQNTHNYQYDMVIDNDGSLGDLEWKAKRFLRELMQ